MDDDDDVGCVGGGFLLLKNFIVIAVFVRVVQISLPPFSGTVARLKRVRRSPPPPPPLHDNTRKLLCHAFCVTFQNNQNNQNFVFLFTQMSRHLAEPEQQIIQFNHFDASSVDCNVLFDDHVIP